MRQVTVLDSTAWLAGCAVMVSGGTAARLPARAAERGGGAAGRRDHAARTRSASLYDTQRSSSAARLGTRGYYDSSHWTEGPSA